MTTDTCKNCTQEIVLRDGLWIHNDGDISTVCELHAEPKTTRKTTGFALWDLHREYTVLFCVECFNERFTASMMVDLAERVDTLLGGGSFVQCFNCAKAVSN